MVNPYTESLKPLWLNRQRKHVFVDKDNLFQLAEIMKKKNLVSPVWATPDIHPDFACSLEEWVNYVCWVNAVNFAFTNFEPPFYKFKIDYRGEKQGSSALGASFMRAKEEGFNVFSANQMKDILLDEARFIFRPIDKKHGIPMFYERVRVLREVGQILSEKYNGSWLNLFCLSNWRAFKCGEGIVERLVRDFSSFHDQRRQKESIFYFHKRAQLAVIMYQGRALHSGGKFPLIEDAEDLGPPCDYSLPKALEYFGVLQYSDFLKRSIDNQFILPENSREEVEIRVATWQAMTELFGMFETWIGPVDFMIWNLGREVPGRHHLTRTIAY